MLSGFALTARSISTASCMFAPTRKLSRSTRGLPARWRRPAPPAPAPRPSASRSWWSLGHLFPGQVEPDELHGEHAPAARTQPRGVGFLLRAKVLVAAVGA